MKPSTTYPAQPWQADAPSGMPMQPRDSRSTNGAMLLVGIHPCLEADGQIHITTGGRFQG